MARAARLRHSDPTPIAPDQTLAPSPKHVSGLLGGWEYPLSREEKKHRVLCLYQAELEQAEKKNSECSQRVTKDCLALPNLGDSFPRNAVIAGIVVLVLAVTIPVLLLSTPAASLKDCFSDELSASDVSALGLPPPNISDRIMGLRKQGHSRLKISNCAEAEWWFSSALKLLSTSSNLSEVDRGDLVGERGFALVCAQSFEAGAEQLEQHLREIGLNQTLPHLTNALAYAYYNMQEVLKAIHLFEAVLKIEPLNPLLWNNLASAYLSSADNARAHVDFEANTSSADFYMSSADHALTNAVYIVEQQPLIWSWFQEELFRNLHNFNERLENKTNKTVAKPNVELWNGFPEALRPDP